jgi:hypothetical protein
MQLLGPGARIAQTRLSQLERNPNLQASAVPGRAFERECPLQRFKHLAHQRQAIVTFIWKLRQIEARSVVN